MAGSARFQVDMALNASDVIKGSNDAAMALADLEDAVGEVADESAKSGKQVDSFATKLVEASRKAGKSDDDIKDALRGMGLSAKQAERAVDDVGDEFKETGREGERAGDKLEDAMRDVQRASEKTSDAVGDVGDKGFRKMGDSAAEASDEMRQNLGETFSSFRGDLEDLPQIAQDVFGGLAGSAGTLAASFGLAGVAGAIGLAIAAFQNYQEQEEQRKERVAEWASTYIDSLGQMTAAVADFASVESIYTDADRYEEAKTNAKNWGVEVSTAVNAMAGDMIALEDVERALTGRQEELNEAMRNTKVNADGTADGYADLYASVNDGADAYDRLIGEMEEGQAVANQYSDSLKNIITSSSEATAEVDELGNTLYTLPDGRQVLISAETGQATADLDAFQGDADDVVEHVNGNEMKLKIATGDAIQGAKDAAAIINNLSATLKVKADTSSLMSAVSTANSTLSNLVAKWQ